MSLSAPGSPAPGCVLPEAKTVEAGTPRGEMGLWGPVQILAQALLSCSPFVSTALASVSLSVNEDSANCSL
jgi:hypothetical protein